jgi:hypothetical protein
MAVLAPLPGSAGNVAHKTVIKGRTQSARLPDCRVVLRMVGTPGTRIGNLGDGLQEMRGPSQNTWNNPV